MAALVFGASVKFELELRAAVVVDVVAVVVAPEAVALVAVAVVVAAAVLGAGGVNLLVIGAVLLLTVDPMD